MNTLRQIWIALTALFGTVRNAIGAGRRTSWGENRDEDDR